MLDVERLRLACGTRATASHLSPSRRSAAASRGLGAGRLRQADLDAALEGGPVESRRNSPVPRLSAGSGFMCRKRYSPNSSRRFEQLPRDPRADLHTLARIPRVLVQRARGIPAAVEAEQARAHGEIGHETTEARRVPRIVAGRQRHAQRALRAVAHHREIQELNGDGRGGRGLRRIEEGQARLLEPTGRGRPRREGEDRRREEPERPAPIRPPWPTCQY